MQDREPAQSPAADMTDPGELGAYRMLLFRASHAQKQLMHPYMASIGLGTGQPKLLSYLAENGSCTPRELADFYELDPAGVSRMLDALERKGFVSFAPHADDRRCKVVSLTSEGERVARAWNAACAEEARAMLDGFTPEEREAFADYLRRAHANLRTYGQKLAAAAAESQATGRTPADPGLADGREASVPAGSGEVASPVDSGAGAADVAAGEANAAGAVAAAGEATPHA